MLNVLLIVNGTAFGYVRIFQTYYIQLYYSVTKKFLYTLFRKTLLELIDFIIEIFQHQINISTSYYLLFVYIYIVYLIYIKNIKQGCRSTAKILLIYSILFKDNWKHATFSDI